MAINTPLTRSLRGSMARTIRLHGPDSPQARHARRRFNTARITALIDAGTAEHGPFSCEQRQSIIAALGGNQ